MSVVGENIKRIRLERHISQKVLSIKANVSQSGISDIENSTRSPSTETIRMIANALGVSQAELLGEEKEPAVDPDDKLKREAIYLFDSLSPAAQEQAMNFLRFLSNGEEKK